MPENFRKPENFVNRELSWLEFNRRVLEEARDKSQPLLERLRFLCIFSSNLDEFFEIRVAGLKQQIENKISDVAADGMSAPAVFAEIRKKVLELMAEQTRLWLEEIQPALAENKISLHAIKDLAPKDKSFASRYFKEEVYPVLTPLAVDSSHPFPQLRSKSHNLIVLLRHPRKPSEFSYGIVQIPRVLPRLVRLPQAANQPPEFRHILLQNLIEHHIPDLFPGLKVVSVSGFRIIRNSELYIDEEEAENLLRTIEEELRKRSRGNAVRIDVSADCPTEIQSLVLDVFKLTPQDLYTSRALLNYLHLLPLCSIDAFPELRDKPFVPITAKSLMTDADIFETVRKGDVLLHHPYESFQSIVDFLHKASQDPKVLAIKITLYRTSGDSPIVRALMNAVANGKQVTVLLELRARFDEANNINWARQMEEAGIHVVYGVVGLKVHAKLLMVVRRDDDQIRHYTHLATGNYHPSTARLYTDLGLLTANNEIGQEVAGMFNTLTGLSTLPEVKKMMVSPFNMKDQVISLIRKERDLAKSGKEGRIIIKCNGLSDDDVITALYEASCAGAQIDLFVRGICCLRPKVPGLSENIRVISIVGRFLEHSRILYFGNGGDIKVYLTSADMMARNLQRRIEVAFPIEDPVVKARMCNEILPAYLSDRGKAREMQADGSYKRLNPPGSTKAPQAQRTFRELVEQAPAVLEASTDSENKLIPLRQPPVAVREA